MNLNYGLLLRYFLSFSNQIKPEIVYLVSKPIKKEKDNNTGYDFTGSKNTYLL